MKFLDRVGLALFSMIVLVISVVLILIGFNIIDSSIFSILIGKVMLTQNAIYIMEGCCVFLILLSLRCLFFGQEGMGSSEDGVLLQNSDGKLLITKQTLENIVDGVTKEFPSINSAKTKVTFDKDNNILINMILDIKEGTVIKDLSSKLQSRVKKSIKEATNLDVQSVDIEILTVKNKTTNDENNEK